MAFNQTKTLTLIEISWKVYSAAIWQRGYKLVVTLAYCAKYIQLLSFGFGLVLCLQLLDVGCNYILHINTRVNQIGSEAKSQQRESDGWDSFMVRRSIEMVSDQEDTIWAAIVSGPLRW